MGYISDLRCTGDLWKGNWRASACSGSPSPHRVRGAHVMSLVASRWSFRRYLVSLEGPRTPACLLSLSVMERGEKTHCCPSVGQAVKPQSSWNIWCLWKMQGCFAGGGSCYRVFPSCSVSHHDRNKGRTLLPPICFALSSPHTCVFYIFPQ